MYASSLNLRSLVVIDYVEKGENYKTTAWLTNIK